MTRYRSSRLPLPILGIRLGAVLLALVAVGMPLFRYLIPARPEIPQVLSLEVDGLH